MRFSARNLNTSGGRCRMFFQQTNRFSLFRYERFELGPRLSEQML